METLMVEVKKQYFFQNKAVKFKTYIFFNKRYILKSNQFLEKHWKMFLKAGGRL